MYIMLHTIVRIYIIYKLIVSVQSLRNLNVGTVDIVLF